MFEGLRILLYVVDRLIAAGATVRDAVQDVGGIRTATADHPFGNKLGVIENPHVALDGG